MSKSTLWGALSLLGLAAALAGCGSSSSTPQGRVRVINALTNVPNNANVDVNVNSNQGISNNIAYGAVNSSAVTVNAGNVPINVLSTGTSTSLVSNSTVNIAQGADNLVLVSGAYGTNAPTNPQIMNLGSVDVGSTPVSNQARIYFINAAPGVSTAHFNLSVTNPSGLPNPSNASADVLYGQMAAAQFVTVIGADSTVKFDVTVAGETIPQNTNLIAGGRTYALVLTGRPNASAPPALATQIIQLSP